jgi:hypothetical protein
MTAAALLQRFLLGDLKSLQDLASFCRGDHLTASSSTTFSSAAAPAGAPPPFPRFVDELDAGHFECPTNALESRATIDPAFSQSLTAADPLAAQTKKNKDGLIDALYIFDIEVPDAVSEFIFWYRGDLINHES